MHEFSFTHLRVVPPLNIEQTFYIWINFEFSNRNTALSFPVHCKQTNMEEKLAKFRERRKLGKPDNVDNGWSPLQWLRSREQVSHSVNGDVHIFQPITCWWATKIDLIIQGSLKQGHSSSFISYYLSPPPLHTHFHRSPISLFLQLSYMLWHGCWKNCASASRSQPVRIGYSPYTSNMHHRMHWSYVMTVPNLQWFVWFAIVLFQPISILCRLSKQ